MLRDNKVAAMDNDVGIFSSSSSIVGIFSSTSCIALSVFSVVVFWLVVLSVFSILSTSHVAQLSPDIQAFLHKI